MGYSSWRSPSSCGFRDAECNSFTLRGCFNLLREAAQDELSSEVFATDAVDMPAETTSKSACSSRARRVDEACAKAVSCLCEVAPAAVLAEDQLLRGPLCILAEAFGLVQGLSPPGLEGSVPKDTLRALCNGLDHCFSNAASHVLMAARKCENLRDSADAIANYFQGDAPAPLLRLLDWIEVAPNHWEQPPQRPGPSSPSMPASSSGLEPSQSSCPQTAASSNSQRPRSRTKTKKKKRSQAEYAELLRRLHEAEEASKLWTAEVESVRQQVKEAEETRDRYLRILQECYDRTTPNGS